MRRADRLFKIIQKLRHKRVVTAKQIAEQMDVSERTIYRDIQDLVASGVPIEGEAGVGYMLRDFDLPPLMFSEEEIEALVLGMRVIQSWADPEQAKAAASVLEKVEDVLPGTKVRLLRETKLYAPSFSKKEIQVDVAVLRKCVREQQKLNFYYEDGKEERTRRVIWPLALTFFAPHWLLLGWCELREDFRSFRLDRIIELEALDTKFELVEGRRLEDYIARMREC